MSRTATAAPLPTLAKVRTAGTLTCGVIQEDAEYSTEDDHGSRGGFDQDLCRAISAAAMGPKASVKIVSFLDSLTAMDALRSGKVDVIASASADFSHSTARGIHLSGPVFYDGVGFLVPRGAKIDNARGLSGHKVCFLAETEAEVSLRAWFEKEHLDFLPFPFQEEGEMEAAFITNNCTALAGDMTRLVNTRISFGSLKKDYVLLPEVISKDPLSAATSDDDEQWSNIVNWVIEALIAGEEHGITSANIDAMKQSDDPAVRELLGCTGNFGTPLGLQNTWAVDILKSTGNYGDIYERAFGVKSERELPRGLNRLWTDGGLMFSLPLK